MGTPVMALLLSFSWVMLFLDGKGHDEAFGKLHEDFWICYKTDLCIWHFVQFENFWFGPPHMQALVVSIISVFWGFFAESFICTSSLTLEVLYVTWRFYMSLVI